jgi:hypothetical protein
MGEVMMPETDMRYLAEILKIFKYVTFFDRGEHDEKHCGFYRLCPGHNSSPFLSFIRQKNSLYPD